MAAGGRMFLVANWKMNMTRDRIETYLDALERERLSSMLSGTRHQIAIAPTHVYLQDLSREVHKRGLPVKIFAQDVSSRSEGAFTGEVSVRNILDVGAVGSILGHSERRRYFRETDADVARKTSLCLQAGAIPLVCFGESREERDAGETLRVLRNQVAPIVEVVTKAFRENGNIPLYLAYEPVWAIGSGKNASCSDIEEVISAVLEGFSWPVPPCILYGGSVNLENISSLAALENLSGLLVGSAWLDPETFVDSLRALS
ncbi:MAG: triose-phosphate isomerase [Nitrospiraceae bacterium]|nr:triose-phosphate isomerase [Nitrospiraceae bacterium]